MLKWESEGLLICAPALVTVCNSSKVDCTDGESVFLIMSLSSENLLNVPATWNLDSISAAVLVTFEEFPRNGLRGWCDGWFTSIYLRL